MFSRAVKITKSYRRPSPVPTGLSWGSHPVMECPVTRLLNMMWLNKVLMTWKRSWEIVNKSGPRHHGEIVTPLALHSSGEVGWEVYRAEHLGSAEAFAVLSITRFPNPRH